MRLSYYFVNRELVAGDRQIQYWYRAWKDRVRF
jgi:endo-alpha-1,4-polygalactosaminidase (GH114 family)